MLTSIRQKYLVCIVKTNKTSKIMRACNSGIGSRTSHPVHLRPSSVFSYIFRFNENQSLAYYIEPKWKYHMRCLGSQGMNNPCVWLRRGWNEFLNLDLLNYGISETMSELRLINLFKY